MAETFKSLHRAIDAVFTDGVSLCRIRQYLGQLRAPLHMFPKRAFGVQQTFLQRVAFLAECIQSRLQIILFLRIRGIFQRLCQFGCKACNFRILSPHFSDELFMGYTNNLGIPLTRQNGLFGLIRHVA
jgi:hypothetical protein